MQGFAISEDEIKMSLDEFKTQYAAGSNAIECVSPSLAGSAEPADPSSDPLELTPLASSPPPEQQGQDQLQRVQA